ncbi:TPA: hypothetical protein ACWWCX_002734 [Enterococcus faecium]
MNYFTFTFPVFALIGAEDKEQALKAYDQEVSLKDGQQVVFSSISKEQAFQTYKEMLSSFVPLADLDNRTRAFFVESNKKESAVFIVEK